MIKLILLFAIFGTAVSIRSKTDSRLDKHKADDEDWKSFLDAQTGKRQPDDQVITLESVFPYIFQS